MEFRPSSKGDGRQLLKMLRRFNSEATKGKKNKAGGKKKFKKPVFWVKARRKIEKGDFFVAEEKGVIKAMVFAEYFPQQKTIYINALYVSPGERGRIKTWKFGRMALEYFRKKHGEARFFELDVAPHRRKALAKAYRREGFIKAEDGKMLSPVAFKKPVRASRRA